jgi:flavin-binding protein dodecin
MFEGPLAGPVPPAQIATINLRQRTHHGRNAMTDSVYKVIELVGTSTEGWEEAARNAVGKAGESLKSLRIAEIKKLDMTVDEGNIVRYRARVALSFKIKE